MPKSCAARACVKRRSATNSLIRMASCTRSFRSSASGKPRSTRTSPLPTSTVSGSVFFSRIACLVVLLRCSQAFPDQVYILLGCAHTRGRLLLETMQNIDRLLESHCIDSPERIAPVLLDQFEDSWPFPLPSLGRGRHSAVLNDTQGIA